MADNQENRGMRQGNPCRGWQIGLLAAVLIAVIACAGIWYWQSREVDRLSDRVAALEKESAEATDQFQERVRQLEAALAAAEELAAQAREAASSLTGQQSNEYTSSQGVGVEVDSPERDARVTSPLTVSGKVPGSWSFEGSFPVELQDASGSVIAQGVARLQGDWMTSDLVAFTVTLTFTSPGSGSGNVVLKRDNPSGLPENDDSVLIPVNF